jgi:4-hydroxy-3-methylbut-2-en-1-yl diphosphate synthase IspG/GcpE
MSSEKIELIDCPVCGRDNFKNVDMLIKHIDSHNKIDPEFNISIMAKQEEYISSLF